MSTQALANGKVVIARNFWDNELYHRSVILILEHDDEGTVGIILNKASCIVDTIPLFSKCKKEFLDGNPAREKNKFIGQIRELAKTIRISEELHYTEHALRLQKVISEEREDEGMRIFLGFVVWKAGRLEQELKEGKWWLDDFKPSELSKVQDKNLWEYKLLTSGHMYGLFGSIPDPGLN